ncbi:SoxR reducing system RseC family protein [endosymbiont of Ridgeia piscesae]|jgi:sigma-E factor negative regulatory protein RseC|uniref:Positive regulator of sigma(E), RseC/MucC n=1 Tax=endosymbiont of Ridgeia piscesae TaxID=54398 RepID=A0A0T5Z9N4_9GAMM|nr:SoxR reducing system RseC family protein [endosymbiont of Ridgeia piscesae]KRT56206.1 positive regulator of sigma(E), RseC/MucC [endosymbiont of Ridgeia piscesae]KRT59515.1 positive regulator of sigma(E), RseC/MucC [endosymbiont of Ridgeia piscesae]
MIEESARVITCDGDYALVETQQQAACGSCQAGSSCGTSVIAGFFKRRHPQLRVRNPIEAKAGQQVVIGLDERALLRASLISYLLPIFTLILCAIAGLELVRWMGIGQGELGSIIGGLLGLIAGLIGAKSFASRHRADALYEPEILRSAYSHPIRLG